MAVAYVAAADIHLLQAKQQPPPQKQLGGGSSQAGWRSHNDENPAKELCRGFQHGDCKIGQGQVAGQCGRNKNLRHQCALCLAVRHGAYQCGQTNQGGKRGRANNAHSSSYKGKKKKGGY